MGNQGNERDGDDMQQRATSCTQTQAAGMRTVPTCAAHSWWATEVPHIVLFDKTSKSHLQCQRCSALWIGNHWPLSNMHQTNKQKYTAVTQLMEIMLLSLMVKCQRSIINGLDLEVSLLKPLSVPQLIHFSTIQLLWLNRSVRLMAKCWAFFRLMWFEMSLPRIIWTWSANTFFIAHYILPKMTHPPPTTAIKMNQEEVCLWLNWHHRHLLMTCTWGGFKRSLKNSWGHLGNRPLSEVLQSWVCVLSTHCTDGRSQV